MIYVLLRRPLETGAFCFKGRSAVNRIVKLVNDTNTDMLPAFY